MAHDVFISYSSKDKTIADAVCASLEAHKIRCWIAPRDILPGMDWGEAIMDALSECKVAVMIFSSHSNASPQVKREVQIAFENAATVIPFRIEDCPLAKGLAYYIRPIHWLDALTPPLEQHLIKLAETVEVLLSRLYTPESDSTPIAAVESIPPPSIVEPGPVPSSGNIKRNAKDGAEMIYIPAGEFLMGSTEEEINVLLQSNPNWKREWFAGETPQRRITLPGYYIYKNVVTVAQYKQFCRETKREMPEAPDFNPNWSKEDHPIVNVSWNDAKAYCNWAGVSLPTEAQWEKSARGVDGRKYPWGNEWDASKCANSVGANKLSGTVTVGRYADSPYGLSDMAGNVWEWCEDDYDGKGERRALRGGSWLNDFPVGFRCAVRSRSAPGDRLNNGGFRCASLADSR